MRICDACYNHTKYELDALQRQQLIASMQILTPGQGSQSSAGTSVGHKVQIQSPVDICKPKNTSLLPVSNKTPGTAVGTASTAGGAGATAARLSETHQLLQQRGEKLAEVSDKSRQMSDQSREFANMAKQLRQKQTSWF